MIPTLMNSKTHHALLCLGPALIDLPQNQFGVADRVGPDNSRSTRVTAPWPVQDGTRSSAVDLRCGLVE
jgi:hypothetical protein